MREGERGGGGGRQEGKAMKLYFEYLLVEKVLIFNASAGIVAVLLHFPEI